MGNAASATESISPRHSSQRTGNERAQGHVSNRQRGSKEDQDSSRSQQSDSLAHGARQHGNGKEAGGAKHQAPAPTGMTNLQPDQVVFETFTNKDGKEFICAYRSGKRFYLDSWHSKEWQVFPERWYHEGTLHPLDGNQVQANYKQHSSHGQDSSHQSSVRKNKDDREGFLRHPKRGRVETYLMEERRYVHFFFDKYSGNWLRLPIGWELHHPLVIRLVQHVEDAVPKWHDPAGILAMLRVCNYNPDECIGTYLHLKGDEWLIHPKSTKEISEEETALDSLKHKVKSQELQVEEERRQRLTAEKQLANLQEQFSKLSAEVGIARNQVEAMEIPRPKSVVHRPKTPGQNQTKANKKASEHDQTVTVENLHSLTESVKGLHELHTHLRMAVVGFTETMRQRVSETLSAVKEMKNCESGSQQELEEVRALYQKEALQKRLLYNQLQELRGNIRVFCRPRIDTRCGTCLKYRTSQQEIVVVSSDGVKKTFFFDKVYNGDVTQEEVFNDTKPIITSCADGYNVCLMAYGQTGSGKTFTMMGPSDNPGINIRAITELLQVCAERAETKTYILQVSIVEVYNETVQDLLREDTRGLDLRCVGNMIHIPDITEVCVKSTDDVKAVIEMGEKNRSVAETKMNSTRSHLLLRISVCGTDVVSRAVSNGVLTLCDLAGSERIGKTDARGQRLVEAAAINKSLSALGQVFTALRSSQLHVPYRNSKLTQILRPCLGGDAKACLFVNVSPDVKNYGETCSTLDFGSNARQVALGQVKPSIRKGPE